MMAVLGPERVESAGLFRRALEPVDEMLIDEARRRRAADDLDERDDVLSLLVQARHEDGRPMSDTELRDELITLLVAGHETTATSLSWAIERLVRHPEKWERLREEALSGGGRLRGRRGEGDAAPAPGAADRRAAADPAGRDRGLAAAGRDARHALHPPRAPAARRLSRAARVPAGALPRAAGGHLHVDPVRRRRAPLPGRELRAVRDEDRAEGDRPRGRAAAGPAGVRARSRGG